MKEFDIEFEVTQIFTYNMSVKAETPEQAIELAKDPEFDRNPAEDDCMLESSDDLDTIRVVGERISDNTSSHRVPFDKPIDGRSEEAKLWDKYKESSGNKCPKCGSNEISGHMINSDYLEAWRDVTCPDCGVQLREFFTMTYMEIL